MRKIILTILAFFVTILTVVAQLKVKGKVTDLEGREAMGIIVSVKETNIGTVTDFNGNYTLEVPDKNAVLIFMAIDEEPIERQIAGETLNIKLKKAISTQKIALFDKYGSKVFEKENVKLSIGNLSFQDFMAMEEYEKLKPNTYFYLISEGKQQRTGYLKKYTKEGQFFRGKEREVLRKTPCKFKFKGKALRNTKIFIEIDGKRTLITKDTIVYGAKISEKAGNRTLSKGVKISLKNNKLIIHDAIPYKEKASLYIGDKEIALDGRCEISSNLFIMSVLRDDEKEEVYIEDNSSDLDKDKDCIFFENKNAAPVLYVVDGLVQNEKKSLNEVSLDSIANISILKGTAATTLYGKRGKNGVIIITTKK